jgi:hypothetical protein
MAPFTNLKDFEKKVKETLGKNYDGPGVFEVHETPSFT